MKFLIKKLNSFFFAGIFIVGIFVSALAHAETKAVNDRVFDVPVMKPEILIGNKAPELIHNKNYRFNQSYYVSLTRSGINYFPENYLRNGIGFKPSLVGVSVGHVKFNNLFYFNGEFDLGTQWERFVRESGINSQKFDLFQINFGQNIELAKSRKYRTLFLAGLGGSFLMGNMEKSVFSNGDLSAGAAVYFKFDLKYLMRKENELIFSIKESWGNINHIKINLTTFSVGVGFE